MRFEKQGSTITALIKYNNPQDSDRSAAESDRTMFECRGRSSFLRTCDGRENHTWRGRNKISEPRQATMDSQSLFQDLHGQKLQLDCRVLTHGETPLPKCRVGNLLPDDDLFGRDFLLNEIFLQANLSDGRSPDSHSNVERKEMEKLRRHHSVRQVITGSTHLRQPTDWLAEIDQAESVQDLDDVGSVFGSTRMSFETLDSQLRKA